MACCLNATAGTLRGTLFVAHGCSHAATDFWPQSRSCPRCIGLPEEVNITARGLARGYAVVAVSSADREVHKCWDGSVGDDGAPSPDTRNVLRVLATLAEREDLLGLPVYALGASSGGAFVLQLAAHAPGAAVSLAGICSQVMALPPSMLIESLDLAAAAARNAAERPANGTDRRLAGSAGNRSSAAAPPYPPVLFVHMPLDQHTAQAVVANVEALKERGVTAAALEVLPRPVTPELLHSKAPAEISRREAEGIVAAFR